ncbi:SdpI family protein [Flavobacterium cerinum]|uniref:SdpI family protein n=1 Tax=Flavobacterium cerinum TaxID=2502784 RepID=A0A444HA68_9FLAO|nr:SdpI family protein [Flavobacterium cerinum]RWX00066.1 SdpI family protein [Flavobacterium cerinum]
MESIIENTFQTSLLCGVIFLLAAGLMHSFPPKEINYLYGYRTRRSMKSKESWDFAQRYSTIQMAKAALFMSIISFAGYLFPAENVALHLTAGMIITIMGVAYMLVTTERELKKRFTES